MSGLSDYIPQWHASAVNYEAAWNIRRDGSRCPADSMRTAAVMAAWLQMRIHAPREAWSVEVCDAIVEATLRTVRDWTEAP
jgi:hypothetical protein